MAAKAAVPVNVGDAENTRLPVPVPPVAATPCMVVLPARTVPPWVTVITALLPAFRVMLALVTDMLLVPLESNPVVRESTYDLVAASLALVGKPEVAKPVMVLAVPLIMTLPVCTP